MRSCATLVLALLCGCAGSAADPEDPHAARGASAIPALRPVADGIWCGGEPHGAVSFAELRALGVRTVVSVDATPPDVEGAAASGLRTIHLPIGYDGIPAATETALARLLAAAEGPFYVHCHHGKHRGPAAAAIVALGAGRLDTAGALRLLEAAGTSRDYSGLWRAVEEFAPPAPDAPAAPLLPVAEVDGLAGAMAMLDRAKDNLAVIAKHGWVVPDDHPDLVVANESAILRQGFTEALRALDAPENALAGLDAKRAADLRERLRTAERLARALEELGAAASAADRSARFDAVVATCKPCHAEHRD